MVLETEKPRGERGRRKELLGIFEGGEAANCLIWGGEAAKVVRRRRKKLFWVFLKVFETDNLFSKPTTYTRLYTPWSHVLITGLEWSLFATYGF